MFGTDVLLLNMFSYMLLIVILALETVYFLSGKCKLKHLHLTILVRRFQK
jgi:hypothetical protein